MLVYSMVFVEFYFIELHYKSYNVRVSLKVVQ